MSTPAKNTPSVTPTDGAPATPAKRRPAESYDIAQSDDTLQLAIDVARFIRENKLFMNMQGKEYVNVEGWQYAGSRLGILPIVTELTNQSDGQEIKYKAEVKLLNLRTEQHVGAGFAICSNKEPGKKFFQEFAIASMAQTRAIGKAYRNILAWLIRAAGYEPTPAEEMTDAVQVPSETPAGPVKQFPDPKVAAVPVPPLAKEKADHILVMNGLKTEYVTLLQSEAFSKEERRELTRAMQAWSQAEMEAKIDEAKEFVRSFTENQDEAATGTTTPAGPVAMATTRQKAEILLLINDEVITKEEKEKMIGSINKLDRERADKAIAKLRKTITERKGGVKA